MNDEQKTNPVFCSSFIVHHSSFLRECTMAEPQEVLPPASPLTSRLPDAPTSPLGDAAEQPYRSLSVLALVGFGMSALYAAICLLLALVALLSRKPMPALDWT